MMWIIWPLLILSSTSCIKVTETQEETDNITTLFPITRNSTNASQQVNPDSLKTVSSLTETLNKDETDTKTVSKEEPVIEKPSNVSKEFKPSVHLGNFFDEDSFGFAPVPTKSSLNAFSPLKKPPSAFIGSHKDDFRSIYKAHPAMRFPYRFEEAILTRAKSKWRPSPTVDSQPTAAAPAEVPAGGLYKKPDAFKDKPELGFDDEEFGLEFNDDKEKFLKKRVNPWKSLLRLLTALIPVGLIVSALTPSLITVHSTGPGPVRPGISGINGINGINEPLPPRLFRRSDEALDPLPAPPPAISEPCRRRLLCELHSEKNYHHDLSGSRRGRACHRLRCEDPAALAHSLRWLLEHRPPNRL